MFSLTTIPAKGGSMNITNRENAKVKILIIDDDENFCIIYKSLLEDTKKYSVTTANSGKEGLLQAGNHKPDVILIDIIMPEMSGGAVACLLSCNDSTKNIPVIFITSLIEPHEGRIDSKNCYLGKPIEPEYLISTIELVVTNSHLNHIHLRAYSQVSPLSGLLPICASCKNIRNDEGHWERIDYYIKKRTDVKFSHGICPDCARKLYPEFYDKYLKEEKD
jgi:CheY-like chemotaxis protein